MSEFKPTTGPWEVVKPSSPGNNCVRIFADSTIIALVTNTDMEMEQLIANANLIAAAPDMFRELAELREYKQRVQNAFSNYDDFDAGAFDALQNAILSDQTTDPAYDKMYQNLLLFGIAAVRIDENGVVTNVEPEDFCIKNKGESDDHQVSPTVLPNSDRQAYVVKDY